MAKNNYISDNKYVKEMAEEIYAIGAKHSVSTVFSDFLLISSYAVSNMVDKVHYEERENEYLRVVKKYTKEELDKFVQLNVLLILALNEYQFTADILGELFAMLNQGNSKNGQFFTPMNISQLMANITIEPNFKEVDEKGYITIMEPTCGSGGMIIAAANTFLEKGYNPSTSMCVCAVDNDIRCAMMTYIQLSYLGIPAVVIHGDSITTKEYTRFYTPVYIFNNWICREQMSMTTTPNLDDEKLKCMLEPLYGIMKHGFNENEEDLK